jgi:hypothetical protein
MDKVDRQTIRSLLQTGWPSDADIVHAARLIIRYRDSRLSPDLFVLLGQAIQQWSLTTEEVFSMARSIWSSGRGPQALGQDQQVGSGADVES